MATETSPSPLARFRPRRETLVWGALLVNTEILLLLAYSVYGNSSLLTLRGLALWLYPFVWINVAIWAVVRTDVPSVTGRARWLAAALTVGYFGVLAYAGGLVGPSHQVTGLSVTWATIPPGWAPAINYGGPVVNLTLIPYKVIGYLGLTYLVFATVVDATRSAVTGALGLLSCVSCSWPVVASLAAGVFGSGSGIAAAAAGQSYTISTAIFVVTVGLLYWRPFGPDD